MKGSPAAVIPRADIGLAGGLVFGLVESVRGPGGGYNLANILAAVAVARELADLTGLWHTWVPEVDHAAARQRTLNRFSALGKDR